jgi:ABC-type multidrug transport system fused ATPase/permease subunit
MIILDMGLQWRLLAYSLLVGVGLGVFYDVMRLSRLFLSLPASPTSPKYYRIISRFKLFRKSGQVAAEISDEPDNLSFKVNDFAIWIVALVEDIVFFIISALVMTVFIFHANNGSVRGFALFGALVGFIVYLFTIGRLTLFSGELVVFLIRELLAWIYIILLLPLASALKRFASWVFRNTIGRIIAIVKKRKLRKITERRAKELISFCGRLAEIIIEQTGRDIINEANQNEHAGKADNISDVRLSDNNLRERGNKVQQTGRRKDAARSTRQERIRKHRSTAK